MENKKICTKCHIKKDLNDFYKQKGGYLGRRADCKLCSKNRITDWKSAHPDYDTEYRKKNRLMINQYSLKYYNNNKEKCREYARNRYKKNLELSTIKWMRNFLYRTEKMGFNKNY